MIHRNNIQDIQSSIYNYDSKSTKEADDIDCKHIHIKGGILMLGLSTSHTREMNIVDTERER